VLREWLKASERLKLLGANVIAVWEVCNSGYQPRDENSQEAQGDQERF